MSGGKREAADARRTQQGAEADGGEQAQSGGARMQAARAKRAQARRGGDPASYNARNAEQVTEFNRLTGNACADEAGGVDVEAVRAWQTEHGVDPDGKVGPKTLAAAGGDPALDEDEAKQVAEKPAPKADSADAQEQGEPGKAPPEGEVGGDQQAPGLDPVAAKSAEEPGEGKEGPPKSDEDYALPPFIDPVKVIELMKLLAEGGKRAAAPEAGGEEKEDAEGDEKPPTFEDTGLGGDLNVSGFVQAAKAVEGEWGDLGPEERREKMTKAANQQLEAIGVYPVNSRLVDLDAQTAGRFHGKDWELYLNKGFYSEQKLSAERGKIIGEMTYHEARHAEQQHKMARLLAGRGKSAKQIKTTLGIPLKVAKQAHETPIQKGGAEEKQASAYFEDEHGAGAEHRDKVMNDLHKWIPKYVELRQHWDALKAAGGKPEEIEKAHQELLKIKEPVMKAYNDYQALPVEADAFAVESKVNAAWDK